MAGLPLIVQPRIAAISSMTARSSRDSRSASLGPVAVLRGMRDLVS
ncbi:hypothetical protein [Escherichia coli]|nr:hypothetical protein [Escherichia coli]